MSGKTPPQQITVDLGEKEADGVFANLALATFSPAEFILDFARIVPGLPKAKVHSRIIMTPQSTKALLRLLAVNIERFEAAHGEIKLANQPDSGRVVGFQSDSEN